MYEVTRCFMFVFLKRGPSLACVWHGQYSSRLESIFLFSLFLFETRYLSIDIRISILTTEWGKMIRVVLART